MHMKVLKESIQYDHQSPVKLFLHSVRQVQSHWHDALEVLFVLDGEVALSVGGERFTLGEGALAITPPSDIHAISAEGANIILALQLSMQFINDNIGEHCTFPALLADMAQSEQRAVRRTLSHMMVLHQKAGPGYTLRLRALALDLLCRLANFNAAPQNHIQPSTTRHIERMRNILDFIDENFKEEITLATLQQREHLSTFYISKFFQKYTGVTFLTYLSSVRLAAAVRELIETDKPITAIAHDNGFSNQKAFFRTFKAAYNDTPMNYRKKHATPAMQDTLGMNYFAIDENKAMAKLNYYLGQENIDGQPQTQETPSAAFGVPRAQLTVDVPLASAGSALRHTWKTLATVACAKDLLAAPVQKQLVDLCAKAPFRFIRFHGVFDDEMMVYTEEADGTPTYNFTYIDAVIDFILSIGVRPFWELGFMPSALASQNAQLFWRAANTSMPKNQQRWDALVTAFAQHCKARYGEKEASSWFYEVWNEPELEGIFWHGSFEQYLEFYMHSFCALKAVLPHAKVGGPATLETQTAGRDYLREFVHYSKQNDCTPDFVSAHIYPDNLFMGGQADDDVRLFDNMPSVVKNVHISQDKDCAAKIIARIKASIGADIPLYITEYNSDAWARNLCHDTCYEAAFIAKLVAENMDDAEAFGYWALSDMMEEHWLGQGPFFGNFGMYTAGGIAKPSAVVFGLLAKLGGTCVHRQEGVFITEQDGRYQILLYNYCHFDAPFCRRDTSAMSALARYAVFNDKELLVTLALAGLGGGKLRKTEWVLNREHGSAFDAWVNMGAPQYPSACEQAYLAAAATPHCSITQIESAETLNISALLTPHEVRLIELAPIAAQGE